MQEHLLQLSGYLRDSLNGTDPAAQKHATEVCGSSLGPLRTKRVKGICTTGAVLTIGS